MTEKSRNYSPSNTVPEQKGYEQSVRRSIVEIKNEYLELFDNYLNRWMAIVEAEIRRVVEGSCSNQVRPKLELIYTSVLN